MDETKLKAILIKIALELKKLGWKVDGNTSDIHLDDNALLLFKTYQTKNDTSIKVSLQDYPDEKVVSPVYDIESSIWIDNANDYHDISKHNDVDASFSYTTPVDDTEIKKAAVIINKQVESEIDSGLEKGTDTLPNDGRKLSGIGRLFKDLKN